MQHSAVCYRLTFITSAQLPSAGTGRLRAGLGVALILYSSSDAIPQRTLVRGSRIQMPSVGIPKDAPSILVRRQECQDGITCVASGESGYGVGERRERRRERRSEKEKREQ